MVCITLERSLWYFY